MMTFLKIIYMITTNMFILTSNTFIKIIFLMINMSFSMFMMSYFIKNNWFMSMFLLLMAGGLMVLFIYFTSSLKLFFKSNKMTLNLSIMLIPIMMIFTKKTMIHPYDSNNLNMFVLNFYTSMTQSLMMILLIIYIMIIMLIMIEMISSTKSPFRTTNK